MSIASLFNTPQYPIQCTTLLVSGKGLNGANVAPLVVESNVFVDNLYVWKSRYCENPGNISPSSDLVVNSLTASFVGTDDLDVNTLGTIADLIVTGSTTTANLSSDVITANALVVNGDMLVDNIDAAGNLDVVDVNASGNISCVQLTSTAVGIPPFVVTSNVQVDNLNAEFAAVADFCLALKSATTLINVSNATAPTAGQVLVATDANNATWQNASSPSGNIDAVIIACDEVNANVINIAEDLLVAGNITSIGWISSAANISATGNIECAYLQASNRINAASLVASGLVSGANLSTAGQVTSSVATGTAPLVVSSTTQVPNLYVARSVLADTATKSLALSTAASPVVVSAASAPTTGQVLTALNATTANWQTPALTGAGTINQVVTNFNAATVNSTTAMPYLSIPQITDGAEFLTITITPQSATSYLKIESQICYYASGGSTGRDSIALFKAGTSNALQATTRRRWNNNDHANQSLTYYVLSGTTSPITFTVRGGNEAGLSMRNNLYMGGVQNGFIMVTEIEF